MSFRDIRDQETAVRLLRNVLRERRIPNAMLFWGPSGVGKRLSAIELAKAVNCAGGATDACDACLSCRKTAHGNHPDVKTIAPTDRSREIKKHQIDEVNELASLHPFEATWRVFIMQDADRMNFVAQNHFLKTLEEPPGASLFLLITEYPRILLPTIRSRCQGVRFRVLRSDTVVDLLKRERDLPDDVAESVAALAQGQMSRAFDLVDSEKRAIVLAVTRQLAEGADPVTLAEDFARTLEEERKQIEAGVTAEISKEGMEELSRTDLERIKEDRLARLNALVKRDILDYLYLLETWYRDELVFRATRDRAHLWNRDQAARLEEKVSSEPGKKIAAVEKARLYLDRFVNEERVFRDLFFALAVP